MTTSVTDFFSSNQIDGALTPEQAAQLLELTASGDTSTTLDNGGAPTTTTAPEPAPAPAANELDSNTTTQNEVQAPAPAAPAPEPAAAPATDAAPAPGAADADPANSVILAKDGKHTIPYSKLEEARAGMQHWKGIAEQSQQQLAQLQAEAAQRAAEGQAPTKTDNAVAQATAAIEQGVDPAIFGDFSDQALAKGIAQLIQAQVAAMVAPVRADVESVKQSIAPLQQTAVKTAEQLHFEAILSKHPDMDSLVESQELQGWIGAQPSFVQPALRQVLEQGTAQQVIELFDNFKKATQTAAPPPPAPDSRATAAAAAKAVTAAAAPAAPISLSDIPGGRVEGRSPQEQLAAKNGPEMVDAMLNMTPAQIEAFLNRGL
jgi:hypothetical protein